VSSVLLVVLAQPALRAPHMSITENKGK